MSIRAHGDQISIWNRNGHNKEIVEKIKQELVQLLQLPENIKMDYNVFNKPAEDKSKTQTRELQPAKDYKPRADGLNPQHEIGGGNRGGFREDTQRRGGYRVSHEGSNRGGYQEG